MGLLDQLVSTLGGGSGGGSGGQQQVQSIANGQGNFGDPASPDHAALSGMMSHVPPGVLQQVLGQVAGNLDPQAYAQHVTPGAGGNNPLGGLESAALGMVASTLIGKLTGGGGLSAQDLMSRIPGLATTNPSQMDAGQVAKVAQYAQQNHPGLFGQAAADIGQQQPPGVLGALLGHAGLSQGAAALASHFLGGH